MSTPLEEANQLAKAKVDAQPEKFNKMLPEEVIAAARSEVWAERPDLREQASEQPDHDKAIAKAAEQGHVRDRAIVLARRKMDRKPARFEKLSPLPEERLSAALTEVYQENPGLHDTHHRAATR